MPPQKDRKSPKIPASRMWTIPTVVQLEDGNVVPDPQAFNYAFAELGAILARLGGVSQVATRREVIPATAQYPERTETTMIIIRWQSFAPIAEAGDQPTVAPDAEESNAA